LPSSDESLAVSIAIATVLAAVLLAVLVAAGGLFGDRSASAEDAVESPACSEWTDGCVVCAGRPEGLACSTPGIACTRSVPRCLKP
jgi:hypothetical protein